MRKVIYPSSQAEVKKERIFVVQKKRKKMSQTLNPRPFPPLVLRNLKNPNFQSIHFRNPNPTSHLSRNPNRAPTPFLISASSAEGPNPTRPTTPKRGVSRRTKTEPPSPSTDGILTPRRPRRKRGRRSEAEAVEDLVRDTLERTLGSMREQDPGIFEGKDDVLKRESIEEDEEENQSEEGAVVEEEDEDWPLDAEVGWGVRASEYFEKHPIRNVVVDGVEIDWEGEMEEGLVKEVNCLEWESFAFHPSPLIVLVFERYNRATENWKVLMELEKAAKVFWNAKDRLPPRTIKIDMNIETDLAYALKVRECPQLLFLRGNRMVYREKASSMPLPRALLVHASFGGLFCAPHSA
ncbi:hypothetical protein QJS04_geneDACA006162 [Acorus gramineus]|uniref:Uncharacterized protein n=1 Tax=Acorus gramineus TaxID=55184 RepID=A0AAV9B2B4_ACOGR|nr:hypothetical protein QJS04_geneDACA006162 [Acorus gramineus]